LRAVTLAEGVGETICKSKSSAIVRHSLRRPAPSFMAGTDPDAEIGMRARLSVFAGMMSLRPRRLGGTMTKCSVPLEFSTSKKEQGSANGWGRPYWKTSGMPPPTCARPRATRRVAMFAYDGCQLIDVTGVLEIFVYAADLLRQRYPDAPPYYTVEILGERKGYLRTSSGIKLVADRSYRAAGEEIDILLIAGGNLAPLYTLGRDQRVRTWLQGMAGKVRRI